MKCKRLTLFSTLVVLGCSESVFLEYSVKQPSLGLTEIARTAKF